MKRILIIDDDQILLSMMGETLQFLGFDTIAAENGTSGVEMAIQQKPDLILCDLKMPSVDGLETLRTIRHSESTAKIPFVLLSGDVEGSTRKEAEQLGANRIIAKPFSTAEILSTLHLTLEEAA